MLANPADQEDSTLTRPGLTVAIVADSSRYIVLSLACFTAAASAVEGCYEHSGLLPAAFESSTKVGGHRIVVDPPCLFSPATFYVGEMLLALGLLVLISQPMLVLESSALEFGASACMPGVDIAADAGAGWSPVLSSPVPVHGRGVSQVPTYNAQVPVPEMEPQTCAGAQNPGWIMHDTRRES